MDELIKDQVAARTARGNFRTMIVTARQESSQKWLV